MKDIRKWFILIVFGFLLVNSNHVFAQKGSGGQHPHVKAKVVAKHHPHKRIIVKSRYRPAKIVVFHPYWGPKRAFNRRWVFFPRYNFYWDNWRKMYAYKNGSVWIINTTPPPAVVNINIDNEKHYELKETEDDIDDVYNTNDTHQTDYKSE